MRSLIIIIFSLFLLSACSKQVSEADASLVQVMVVSEANARDRPSATKSQIKRAYLAGALLRGRWVLGGPENKQRWFRVDSQEALFLSEDQVLAEGYGLLTGQLSYPSEYIPEDMKVCAENISNGSVVCAKEINISQARYNLAVPEGTYYIWSETLDWAPAPDYKNRKVYYTEAVVCGLSIDCENHAKKPIKVTSFSITPGVDPGDYYDF